MTAVTALPQSRPLTYDDLAGMPDDGHRYELLDGVLLVSPAPIPIHQRAVGNLHLALRRSCPDELEVFLAPFDVLLADDTVLEPDLVVARRSDLGPKNLPAVPVLVVEVLSPSTRTFDLMPKRVRFERAGCPHYWAVDPAEPSIVAWTLQGDSYAEVARVVDEDVFQVDDPYTVEVVPRALVTR